MAFLKGEVGAVSDDLPQERGENSSWDNYFCFSATLFATNYRSVKVKFDTRFKLKSDLDPRPAYFKKRQALSTRRHKFMTAFTISSPDRMNRTGTKAQEVARPDLRVAA
jgi:hypothetical protein